MAYRQGILILEPWHDEFINMLADPSDKRSNAAFFREHGIDEKKGYRWLTPRRAEVYEEANRRLRVRKTELRVKGYKRLESLMDDKSGAVALKAVELLMKLNGDLIERIESRTEMLTLEQKKERVARLLSEAAGKYDNSKTEAVAEVVPEVVAEPFDPSAPGYDPIKPEYGPTTKPFNAGEGRRDAL